MKIKMINKVNWMCYIVLLILIETGELRLLEKHEIPLHDNIFNILVPVKHELSKDNVRFLSYIWQPNHIEKHNNDNNPYKNEETFNDINDDNDEILPIIRTPWNNRRSTHIIQQPIGSTHLIQKPIGSTHIIQQSKGFTNKIQQPMGYTHVIQQPYESQQVIQPPIGIEYPYNLNNIPNKNPEINLQQIALNNEQKQPAHQINQPAHQINLDNSLIDLKTFILDIIYNKKLNDIPHYLLESFLTIPNLEKYIEIILQNENIPPTTINPQIAIQLIHLIKQIKNKEPITDIDLPLLEIILNLQGAERLVPPLLTWVQNNKTLDMMHIFLDIVKRNGGKEIPQNLRLWLLSLPNGKQIIDYLQLPGDIQCTQHPGSNIKCIKIRITELQPPTIAYPKQKENSDSQIIPDNVLTVLKTFIFEIVKNKKLIDISPKLLEILTRYPNLNEQIDIILKSGDIPHSKLNSTIIIELINLIKTMTNKEPIKDNQIPLLKIVLNLQGAEELVTPLLTWVQNNNPAEMMNIFLDIIKRNGGKEIPQNLRLWLLSLPNGKQMIEYLELPGEIKCTSNSDNNVKCLKTSINEVEPSTTVYPIQSEKPDSQIIPNNILLELKTFILEMINNKRLHDISPNSLKFFIRHPNLEKHIENILHNENIPYSTVTSHTIIQLINIINQIQNKEPIKDIPIALLEMVLNLQGAERLVPPMLTWVQNNKTEEMMHIFLDIVKGNGGKEIPQNLLNWLLSLANGKQMIGYLLLPGEIKCTEKFDGSVECIKMRINVHGSSETMDSVNYNCNKIN